MLSVTAAGFVSLHCEGNAQLEKLPADVFVQVNTASAGVDTGVATTAMDLDTEPPAPVQSRTNVVLVVRAPVD